MRASPGRGVAGAALMTLLAALLTAGCGGDSGLGSDAGSGTGPNAAEPAAAAQVDLDTAELRAVRREAGLDPCRNGPGEPGRAAEGGLPPVQLPCFGADGSVDLATLRGPMVVSLWASWCPPCRRELPILQEFAERSGDEVAVLGIDYADQQTSNAGDLLLESGVTYPQLADPGGELSGADPLPRIAGLPFLALVDVDGQVVHQEFRELDDVADLERLVDRHLGVGP